MVDVSEIVDLRRAREDAKKHFARLARKQAKVIRRYERLQVEYERIKEGLRCTAEIINAASRELYVREMPDVAIEISCVVDYADGREDALL